MSVILNALRSKEAQKNKKEPVGPKEGLFFEKEKDEGVSSRARMGILLAVLFSVSVFSFMKFSSELLKTTDPQIALNKQNSTVEVAAKEALVVAPTDSIPDVKFDVAIEAKKAQELLVQNKLTESLAIFEKLIQHDPQNAMYVNDSGFILFKQDRLLEAESRFRKAVKINPKCAECFNNLGMLSTQLGRFDEAQEFLEKSITLNPNYPDPHFNIAVLLQKAGDETAARAHFEDFLSLTPQKSAPVALQVRRLLNDLDSANAASDAEKT